MARLHPEEFDGILVGAPVINWTKLTTNAASCRLRRSAHAARTSPDSTTAMNQLPLILQDPTIGLSTPGFLGLPMKFVNSTLQQWTEERAAPVSIVMSNAAGTRGRPLCPYPKKIAYVGGDVNAAASYVCSR